jgi:hypothetical protein
MATETPSAPAADSSIDDTGYVEMHATCTQDRIAVSAQGDLPDRIVENPVTFLTGLGLNGEPLPARSARRPCFSLVVGQYGLGKTTLMDRSKVHLQRYRHPQLDPKPVLVHLVRRGRGLASAASMEAFRDSLFGEHGPTLEEIYLGSVQLLLDGLDEVATGQKEHNTFFENLAKLVSAGAAPGRHAGYHIVVSMRQEYLTSVTRDDAQELTALIKEHTKGEPQVNFLSLDWMEPGQARSFLGRRIKDGVKWWDELSKTHSLREMLRRPLLLRIFSDLLSSHPELRTKVEDIRHVGDLLSLFVETADQDQLLAQGQRAITSFRWDRVLLAEKSLQLYQEGRSAMTLGDLRDIVVDEDGVPGRKKPNLTDEDALKGIHKCPFLLLENAPDVELDQRTESIRTIEQKPSLVRFSHAIFFEYFTASGMNRDEHWMAFDELVLNVDMRKFLRGMVGPEWHVRTKRSYALLEKDWHEWDIEVRNAEMFQRLDEVRIVLLDLMSDPEHELRNSAKRIEECIDWLLDGQEQFHPRYLVFNFEAVAVYARARTPRKPDITARFSGILQQRLQKVMTEGIDDGFGEHLLVERMLDIGQRLRLDWVRPYADGDSKLLPLIHDRDTRKRIKTIFENIRSTLWL